MDGKSAPQAGAETTAHGRFEAGLAYRRSGGGFLEHGGECPKHWVGATGSQNAWTFCEYVLDQLCHTSMVTAAAVVGRLSHLHVVIATCEPGRGIEPVSGGCSVEHHDPARTRIQCTPCQEREWRAPESSADAEQCLAYDRKREPQSERTEYVQGIPSVQRRKPRCSLADHFEDEAAAVVLNPRHAHRSTE